MPEIETLQYTDNEDLQDDLISKDSLLIEDRFIGNLEFGEKFEEVPSSALSRSSQSGADPVVRRAFRNVVPGENIQQAVDAVSDAGGGTVFLRSGTHIPPGIIEVPTGIHFKGENPSTTTLSFNSTSNNLRLIGSNAETTGTVDVTNNSTTVTGTGTTFTSSMVGRDILLSGLWYPISAFTSTTVITIGLPFGTPDISTANFVIATIVEDIKISDMLITSSTANNIVIQYSKEVILDNLDIQSGPVGLDIDDSSQITLADTDVAANNAGIQMDNVHFSPFSKLGVLDSLTGIGIEIDTCTNISIETTYILNSAGDAVDITNSSNLSFADDSMTESGGHGMDFVATNSNISVSNCAIENNTTDGVQLTATTDRCNFEGNSFADNGAFGVDIANANCDNNIFYGNQFNGNTSGSFNDLGTDTIKHANTGITIHNQSSEELRYSYLTC